MLQTFSLAAPLVIAAVLAVSGIAKLRQPQPARDAFVALGMPGWLTRSPAPTVLPWAEVALAVALLALPGWWGVAAALVSLLLMLAYLVVIIRAVGFDEAIQCHCFGELGLGAVDRRTIVRNALLVAVAALAALGAAADRRAVVAQWWAATPADWAWLLMAVLVGALAVLILGGSPQPAPPAPPAEVEEEYIRRPIPMATLHTFDGVELELHELAHERAQLLVFLNPHCGPCARISDLLPTWRTELDGIADVRPVYGAQTREQVEAAGGGMAAAVPESLVDPHLVIHYRLGVGGTPSAVLVGADGLLAGGPVTGETDVVEMVDEVLAEVAAARTQRD